MSESEKVIVLGLGNALCGDDGFGIHTLARLADGHVFPGHCELIDGGSQGQILYGVVEDADRLLLIDACDYGKPSGTLAVYENDEIPVWLGKAKLSAHQGSFAEVLCLAQLRGVAPREIKLIGLQPERVEFGQPLSRAARNQIAPACQLALKCLAAWGIAPLAAQGAGSGTNRDLLAAFC